LNEEKPWWKNKIVEKPDDEDGKKEGGNKMSTGS